MNVELITRDDLREFKNELLIELNRSCSRGKGNPRNG
jgi:hypothetical protein